MRPSVRRVEELYAGQVDFHILNVDEASTRDLATKYRVSAIPNIVLLDAAGNLVRQIEGFQTEEQLIAGIDGLLAAVD